MLLNENLKNLNKITTFEGWILNLRFHSNYIFVELKNHLSKYQVIFKKNKFSHNLRVGNLIFIRGINLFRKFKDYFLINGIFDVFCLIFKFLNFYIYYVLKDLRFYFISNFFKNNFLIKNYFFCFINLYFFYEKFKHIETPIICKYFNEGSHPYVIPLNIKKNFFSLSQSPQIFKQLLIIFGFNKYYQFSKCFRNEDLKFNRLHEFTQIDFECSFHKNLDIIFFIKKFFFYVIYKIFLIKKNYNFSFLYYKDCYNKFLNDKPDLRFKSFLTNFKLIYLYFYNKFKNLKLKIYFNFFFDSFKYYFFFLKNYKFKFFLYIFYNIYYFNFFFLFYYLNIIFFEIFSFLNYFKNSFMFLNNFIIKNNINLTKILKNNFLNFKFLFLIVINFPLFKYNFNFKKYFFLGNPFSKPIVFDSVYLDLNPINCFSKSYDIILNGQEIGGGSVRNNFFFIQKKVFLISYNYFELFYNFNFFLNFLKKSAPHHCGAAIGFDRILMCFLGLKNIKNISIFDDINFNYNIFKTSNFII